MNIIFYFLNNKINFLAYSVLFVPRLLEEKWRDLVFAFPSFLSPIEVGTLWMQLLLQFCTDSFETSLVFWSWSEDMHMVWI